MADKATLDEKIFNRIKSIPAVAWLIVVVGVVGAIVHTPAQLLEDFRKLTEETPKQAAVLKLHQVKFNAYLLGRKMAEYKYESYRVEREETTRSNSKSYMSSESPEALYALLNNYEEEIKVSFATLGINPDLRKLDLFEWSPYPVGIKTISDLLKGAQGAKAGEAFLLGFDIEEAMTHSIVPLGTKNPPSDEDMDSLIFNFSERIKHLAKTVGVKEPVFEREDPNIHNRSPSIFRYQEAVEEDLKKRAGYD